MKKINLSLYKQLISIGIIIFGIIFISLGILLPKVLLPIYEKNVYEYLKEPLVFVEHDALNQNLETEVAYIYLKYEGSMIISENFKDVVSIPPTEIVKNLNGQSYGKIKYYGQTYYFNSSPIQDGLKLAITNNSYILQIRKDIINTIFPIIFITLVIIIALVILWAKNLISKIEYLKEKVENLDNDNYKNKKELRADDELKMLSDAIDNMKITLKKQDEYKNQMYQNISHDFKTPLTVIKSYLEAYEDGMETGSKTHDVIKEEVNKLENKVHSLLYLNKLSYISDSKKFKNEKTDISIILKNSIPKFKIQRNDVDFKIYLKDQTIYKGSYDMWEAIIDNILNNFIRYADKVIKITIKNNQLSFYNDGPNIDENILNDLFTPYKKGINGQFGLGLSIVKKTLHLCGYEISVKNEKKGISFIIKEK